MAELILGPMLRHVTETSATIWLETDERCVVEILGRSVPTFCVADHHYALVMIEGLQSATRTEYSVLLNSEVRWPDRHSALPASAIQTLGGDIAPKIIFGSCRTAAPHEAPWTLELALDQRGRGVDALYAYALAMLELTPEEWPHLAVFLGDQIYADDSSPRARERIAAAREGLEHDPEADLPAELVGGFEEYTWLYHESWSPEIERWFFSNVPSVMIFDDHEMIDDWNISDSWVRGIRQRAWWEDHVIGGLMTYWLYQHLGNLSPEVIRAEGLLDSLSQVADGADLLREWAMRSEEFTAVIGGYRFNFTRDIGRVRLVMIDARNGRVLEPGKRQMVDDDEWEWVVAACHHDVDHLLIGTSLPAFVPGGLHDLQVWSEAICDGAWGRPGRKFGEWLRVKLDMEDWPAFINSFEALVGLVADVGADVGANVGDDTRDRPPATISVLSGDIHFSYASEIVFPPSRRPASRVHQLVSSPIRNALTPPERTAMRLGTSRFAKAIGRMLRRASGGKRSTVTWKVDRGPIFANCLGQLYVTGRAATLTVLQASAYDESAEAALETVFDVDLAVGARATRATEPPAAGG